MFSRSSSFTATTSLKGLHSARHTCTGAARQRLGAQKNACYGCRPLLAGAVAAPLAPALRPLPSRSSCAGFTGSCLQRVPLHCTRVLLHCAAQRCRSAPRRTVADTPRPHSSSSSYASDVVGYSLQSGAPGGAVWRNTQPKRLVGCRPARRPAPRSCRRGCTPRGGGREGTWGCLPPTQAALPGRPSAPWCWLGAQRGELRPGGAGFAGHHQHSPALRREALQPAAAPHGHEGQSLALHLLAARGVAGRRSGDLPALCQ